MESPVWFRYNFMVESLIFLPLLTLFNAILDSIFQFYFKSFYSRGLGGL